MKTIQEYIIYTIKSNYKNYYLFTQMILSDHNI